VSTGPAFRAPIAVLRMFDIGRSRDFHVGFLGLRVDWEHRFEPGLPLYMQVSLGALVLHLSEHHGDGSPGAVVYVWMTGLDAFNAEQAGRSHRHARPAIEAVEWGARVMEVADPTGNRLRFAEEQP
jgi:catechol 2,3-dioxygenase-like lactoylglutathione lyase family enzyme